MFRPRILSPIAGIALALSAVAQQPAVMPPPAPTYSFPDRQTLTYSVDWRVFTAGQAVFHLETANGQVKISATADTVGATNMLYPVADKYQSTFDAHSGCSSGFSKQIQEGRRKVNTDLTFNYAAGRQHLQERNLVKGTGKQQDGAIPSCVTDSLSAIFYAASQPMTVGQSFEFILGDAKQPVIVTMKAEAKEEIKTPAGSFQTIRVQPTADAGVVKNRGNIWIWYTDDARHLPVQIRARLFWGTITFHLQSVEAK